MYLNIFPSFIRNKLITFDDKNLLRMTKYLKENLKLGNEAGHFSRYSKKMKHNPSP